MKPLPDQSERVIHASLQAPSVAALMQNQATNPPAPKPARRAEKKTIETKPSETKPSETKPSEAQASTPAETLSSAPADPVLAAPETETSEAIAPTEKEPATAKTEPQASPSAITNVESAPASESAARRALQINLPPPVVIRYDLEIRSADGSGYSGGATIRWRSDGSRYRIDVEANKFFITALSSHSVGDIDAYGIAPRLYSDKPLGRARVNTHFNRERNQISFSASTAIYPRQGGEQDRASIIWQLVGIGRGNSDQFVPGTNFDVFVAGVRNGEVWRFVVAGEEALSLGSERLRTWHVVRTPPPGSFDEKLDIWLAPEREWYPVRIRKTETKGDVFDLRMTSMRAPRDLDLEGPPP